MTAPSADAGERTPLGEELGRGAHRRVHAHPTDPSRCIKVNLPLAERGIPGRTGALVRAWRALRPQRDPNLDEWAAWRTLHARLGDALARVAAPCLALEPGADGMHLHCVRLRNADGTPARSLNAILAGPAGVDAAALVAALDRFEAALLALDIPLTDLNGGNLMLVQGPPGEAPMLQCVDLKSVVAPKGAVPFANTVPALRRRKLVRRAARLRRRILATLAPPPPRH